MIQRVQLQPMSKRQITEKIVASMVAQKAEHHYMQYQTGEIRRDIFANAPTVSMQTTGSMKPVPLTTKPMLLLDKEGRPFTMAADCFIDTMTLIEEQIQKFVSIEGRYPGEILLSPLRFLAKGGQLTHYVVHHFNIDIPIHFDRQAYEIYNYEVCVRGE